MYRIGQRRVGSETIDRKPIGYEQKRIGGQRTGVQDGPGEAVL